jgi:hypothetical protein
VDVEVGEDVDDAGPASGFSLSGWLEKMLRELPFPCGPWPPFGWWEGPLWIRPRRGLAAYEIWALSASYSINAQCTSKPRAETYSIS